MGGAGLCRKPVASNPANYSPSAHSAPTAPFILDERLPRHQGSFRLTPKRVLNPPSATGMGLLVAQIPYVGL